MSDATSLETTSTCLDTKAPQCHRVESSMPTGSNKCIEMVLPSDEVSSEVELHKDDVDAYNMFCKSVISDEMRQFIRGVLAKERANGHPLPR